MYKQTIVIWDEVEASLKFFKLQGDYSHLDRVYVNSDAPEEKIAELLELVYDENLEKFIVDIHENFDFEVNSDVKVIVAGFYP